MLHIYMYIYNTFVYTYVNIHMYVFVIYWRYKNYDILYLWGYTPAIKYFASNMSIPWNHAES